MVHWNRVLEYFSMDVDRDRYIKSEILGSSNVEGEIQFIDEYLNWIDELDCEKIIFTVHIVDSNNTPVKCFRLDENTRYYYTYKSWLFILKKGDEYLVITNNEYYSEVITNRFSVISSNASFSNIGIEFFNLSDLKEFIRSRFIQYINPRVSEVQN